MRYLVSLVLAAAFSTASAAPLSAVECYVLGDVLFARIIGQQAQTIPPKWEPLIDKAVGHLIANLHRAPYYHAAVLMLQCTEHAGDVERMYQGTIADPEQPVRRL